jgi:hypothetical protein
VPPPLPTAHDAGALHPLPAHTHSSTRCTLSLSLSLSLSPTAHFSRNSARRPRRSGLWHWCSSTTWAKWVSTSPTQAGSGRIPSCS